MLTQYFSGMKSNNLPLIKGQVSVSKLCEQCSLQNFLRGLVLDEIDNNMLQSVVILRWCVLLGKPQETGILQLDGLIKDKDGQILHQYSSFYFLKWQQPQICLTQQIWVYVYSCKWGILFTGTHFSKQRWLLYLFIRPLWQNKFIWLFYLILVLLRLKSISWSPHHLFLRPVWLKCHQFMRTIQIPQQSNHIKLQTDYLRIPIDRSPEYNVTQIQSLSSFFCLKVCCFLTKPEH